jgi:hypothetical protein
VFTVLGALAVCSHEGGGNCIIVGSLGAAPIGAGVGLAMGALISGMRTIYRAPESRASVPESRAASGVHASLLEDLALRVNLDDELRVEDQSGARTTSRLTRLTADEMTLQTAVGEKHHAGDRPAGRRASPATSHGCAHRAGAAATGAVAACTGPEREECADAPVIAGALGAGLGLAAGALMHRTTIVYPEAEKRIRISPVISRDAVGVRVSRRW